MRIFVPAPEPIFLSALEALQVQIGWVERGGIVETRPIMDD
jgi:hypothetical protein